MNGAAENIEQITISPQAGPQTEFLTTEADIAIYGGAAGGGKSFGLLLEDFRHHNNPKFGSVTFRKNSTQVRNEGGLWDESVNLYPLANAHPREANLEWVWPSGMRSKFAHLEYERSVLDWQGTAIALLKFDELTHFSEYQFFYMLTRNRSTSGVRPYVRATTNPDPDSWVRKFIDWWIGEDGFPIKERAGKLRWFIRVDETIIWGNTKEEIFELYGKDPEIQPKSVTFIPSKLEDNKILMEKDPGYLANLLAQDRVTRLRLREGNWNVRASAGMMFQRQWFEIIDAVPAGWIQAVRYWDRAATKPSETNKNPDWTRGLKMYKYPNGLWVVVDLQSLRDSPLKVDNAVKMTATHDGTYVAIVGEQDPGSAGVADAGAFARLLAGYDVRLRKPTTDKETRAKPVSAQSEAGNIKIMRAPWNEEFFSELENFPDGSHDDIVDVFSGAFNEMCGGTSILDVL